MKYSPFSNKFVHNSWKPLPINLSGNIFDHLEK